MDAKEASIATQNQTQSSSSSNYHQQFNMETTNSSVFVSESLDTVKIKEDTSVLKTSNIKQEPSDITHNKNWNSAPRSNEVNVNTNQLPILEMIKFHDDSFSSPEKADDVSSNSNDVAISHVKQEADISDDEDSSPVPDERAKSKYTIGTIKLSRTIRIKARERSRIVLIMKKSVQGEVSICRRI